MPSTQAVAIVQEFVAQINRNDPNGIIALCTDDHVFTDSLGSTLSGLTNLKEGWAGYFSLFPDYRIEIESAVAQDMLVLACGFASATHAESKKTWRIPAAWRAKVVGRQIAEWQVYADNRQSMNCSLNRPNRILAS